MQTLRHQRGHTLAVAITAALATTTLGSAVANAQERAARGASTLLEEVMVTATKKSQAESIQDVPIAISAFNNQQLEAMFAQDIRDVGTQVPNVMFTEVRTVPGTPSFFIRGTGSGQSIQSYQPGVGIFQDGMFLGVLAGSIVDTFDLESVEVLRGPQGMLFGRNVSGGAVVTRTIRPSGEFGARVKAATGSQSLKQFNVMVEGPLTDSVAGLISVNSKDADGYLENTNKAVSDTIGEIDLFTTRGVLTFNPTEDLDITAIGSLYRSKGGGTPSAAAVQPPDASYVGQSQRPDFLATGHNIAGYSDQDIRSLVLEANYALDNGVVTAIAGTRSVDMDTSSDLDGTTDDFFNAYIEVEHEQTSFELRYASDAADWGSFTTGLFWWDSQLETGELRMIAGGRVGQGAWGEEDNSAFAVFAQSDIRVTDDINLVLGLRWNSEDKDAGATPLAECPLTPIDGIVTIESFPGKACGTSLTGSKSWTNWQPKVGLQWFSSENTQWYASYTSGFRSGSYNVRTPAGTTDLLPADEETTDAYELGVKTSFMDERIRINAALFRNDIDDFQEISQQTTASSELIQTLVNAGSARTQGLELEVNALLAENLVLNASVGLLDAEYTELNLGSVPSEVAEQWDFVKTPDKTANLALTYDQEIDGIGVATFRTSYFYRGEMASGFNQSSRAEGGNPNVIESYGELNASVVLNTADDHWTFALSGKNLLDDENADSRFYISRYLVEYVAPGLTWTASAEYRF